MNIITKLIAYKIKNSNYCFIFSVAPPPKALASRRTTTAISNGKINGNCSAAADPFGLDPFEIGVIEGDSVFQKSQPLSKISVDDFTLESLDPLRK